MTAMERVVWKFPLELRAGVQEVDANLGARVIHVHEQQGQVCVWVDIPVDPFAENHPTKLFLQVVATGEEFVGYRSQSAGDWPNAGEYRTHAVHRGTAHIGWTVWHVYQLQSQPD